MAWRKIVLLSSAARTATTASAKQNTPNIERVIVFVNATTIAATETITVTIRGYKPDFVGTPETYDILTGAAISTASNQVLEVGPGVTEDANLIEARAMPPEWDINVVHSASGSHTYEVGAWVYERP